jgi:hypothetical protein
MPERVTTTAEFPISAEALAIRAEQVRSIQGWAELDQAVAEIHADLAPASWRPLPDA